MPVASVIEWEWFTRDNLRLPPWTLRAFLGWVGCVRLAPNPMDEDQTRPGPRQFPSTHWSVVMRAGRDSSETARTAFERLYLSYRSPVLAFLRRSGHAEPEAEEFAQGFFAYLLAGNGLASVNPTGRFRNWLITCLKNFVTSQRVRDRAVKRGGRAEHVPVGPEVEAGEIDPAQGGRTPEQEFDRQFALQFIHQVMDLLRGEYALRGAEPMFDRLRPLLLDTKGDQSQVALARELGLSSDNLNQQVRRLRLRYRELFDRELGRLVGDRADLADEKRCLLDALRTP